MTLTVALAIVGGLVLAIVIAQGAWNARKAGPKRADGPLPPAARVEPSLGGAAVPADAAAGAAVPAEPGAATEPVLADDDLVPALEARLPAARRASARLDALVDAIAPLTLESPVTGELALLHLPPTRRAGTKPFIVEGLNADSGEWELPAPGQRYGEFQAGVQLANRHGALNEIEYSEFVQKVEAFAEAVGALAQFPDMLDVVARARELDAFANAHDAQLAMHLRAQGAAWSVGYIQQCAQRQGFVPGALPGRLVMPSAEEGAPPLLSLSFDAQAALADDPNQAAVRKLTLSLDVPQTAPEAEPFAAWQEAARSLSTEMDAVLVDDQGQPVTLHAFSAIDGELQQLYQLLAARDLGAGSAAARRLFS